MLTLTKEHGPSEGGMFFIEQFPLALPSAGKGNPSMWSNTMSVILSVCEALGVVIMIFEIVFIKATLQLNVLYVHTFYNQINFRKIAI